jgi:hypothetical protein
VRVLKSNNSEKKSNSERKDTKSKESKCDLNTHTNRKKKLLSTHGTFHRPHHINTYEIVSRDYRHQTTTTEPITQLGNQTFVKSPSSWQKKKMQENAIKNQTSAIQGKEREKVLLCFSE